jgi:hypothetical protein
MNPVLIGALGFVAFVVASHLSVKFFDWLAGN